MGSVLAIDPGTTESAYVVYLPSGDIFDRGKLTNEQMLAYLKTSAATHLAVEMIASYGMPVGAEVFETCVWIGRYLEAWSRPHTLVYRREVKLHLCGSARAKDGNIRQALLDKWGGREAAVGKKKTPGPLYGISADVWAALGVAVTWAETKDVAA